MPLFIVAYRPFFCYLILPGFHLLLGSIHATVIAQLLKYELAISYQAKNLCESVKSVGQRINLREFKTKINVKNISPKTFLFKKIFVT